MEGEQFISNNKDGTDFREIVLNHLRKILEISSEELRVKTLFMKGPQGDIVHLGQEDTRESYVQAIEALAIVLLPYFDEKINEVYQEKSQIMNSWNFELKDLLKEHIEKVKEKTQREELPKDYYMRLRVESARGLFKELNLLLKRQDYLKGAVFGERE